MKLLLCEDVEKLGWLGDIVNVKDGHARNYLLPQGLAIIPTEANINSLAEEKARRSEVRKLENERLGQVAENVDGAEVVLSAKANEQGHLFGSIAQRDIAENLRLQGFEIKDAMVQLPDGHIKDLGTHDISLKIAAELKATVKVVIVSEDQTDQDNTDNTDETVDAVEQETTTEE
ncbi:MAG: 50S ribosomal protein L9 [Planctomycetota bacterium]|jgi:large subunit ribosomal protein L9